MAAPNKSIAGPATPAAPVTPAVPVAAAPAAAPLVTPIIPKQNLGSEFSFDTSLYLPDIEANADSIYNPQQDQLDVLAQIGQSKTDQSVAKTQKQFADQLESTIESINQRGAFFSGGAANQEHDIRTNEGYALTDINLNNIQYQTGILAEKAGLSSQRAEYIADKLTGTENSAYTRFINERTYLRSVFESDRSFELQEEQFDLTKEKFEYDKFKFGEEYALDMAQFTYSQNKAYKGTAKAAQVKSYVSELTKGFGEITRGDDKNLDTGEYKSFIVDAYSNADTPEKIKAANDFVLRNKGYLNPNDFKSAGASSF